MSEGNPAAAASSSGWSSRFIVSVYVIGIAQILYIALKQAYEIRLHAITEYGRVIHEFDPYFNYRATEYLWANGWEAFSKWYDYLVWYPLGRPVGTTIYPGLQVTSVLIKKYILQDWSINDICCLVPAWFGVIATTSVALFTYQCTVITTDKFESVFSKIPVVNIVYNRMIVPVAVKVKAYLKQHTGSTWGLGSTRTPAMESAVFAACIMAIVPAHLTRSIGGGYDNESIAMTAMSFTFFAWTRALKGTSPNYIWSIIAGLAYFYMVAAWGGYVFVINLVGIHATILVLLGRYSVKLHRAYTIFYIVGTSLAIQVPVVGLTPLKSLEQMGPLLAFVAFQVIEAVEIIRRKRQLDEHDAWKLRTKVYGTAAAAVVATFFLLAPTGYFGPISSRVRGLFVQHTKTGNPLVDSVAEHQPASAEAYYQYLHNVCYIVPIGFIIVALTALNDSSSFLLVHGTAAYFFSNKMARLILLTAPIASALGGIALGYLWMWCVGSIVDKHPTASDIWASEEPVEEPVKVEEIKKESPKKKKKKSKASSAEDATTSAPDSLTIRIIRIAVSIFVLLFVVFPGAGSFYRTSHEMSYRLSHPSIIQKGQMRDGSVVVVDDYREAYWWLRDHTPADARIMAWWDYGYQITGIANRTTLADGNTWNHEHIALLGRALTSPEKEGHRMIRHLADYVLVWGGGGGDDLAKSPHLARIANSVYRNMCPGDPTCRSFGFVAPGKPSPSMAGSVLYKLHSQGLQPGVEVDPNRFKEVFRSKYGKVRIYQVMAVSKESRDWVADPANRICDQEGGWFCKGQYPPALQNILDEKKDFRQLEDFNAQREDDSEYQKKYMKGLNIPA